MVDLSSLSLLSEKSKENQMDWMEWLKGWCYIIYEVFFQKVSARNLRNPLPLPSLNDQTCIVTGSTSGIGLEIARQLAESGAHVVMAVRNPAAAHELIKNWQNIDQQRSFNLNIDVMELDLLSLESVATFAKSWNSLSKPLHILVNNAGIFSIGQPQKFTKDGYENHLQVNHLGPALLSLLLLPSLIKTSSSSRIVNVNSTLHFIGHVDPNDMNFKSSTRKFTNLQGYSSSKLAQIMFFSTLQRRLPVKSGVSIICVNLGSVRTNVARNLPRIMQLAYHYIPFCLLNPQEGSRSAIFAATDTRILEYSRGLKANEWPVCAYVSHSCEPISVSRGAHDAKIGNIVWEKTLSMVGLDDDDDVLERILRGEDVQCRYGGVQIED